MKSPVCQQPEFTPLWVEYLDAPHVSGQQADRCVEDAPIQGVEVSLPDERRADFLQRQHLV
jgi:hypothetical protein